jgi:hypothetical protein
VELRVYYHQIAVFKGRSLESRNPVFALLLSEVLGLICPRFYFAVRQQTIRIYIAKSHRHCCYSINAGVTDLGNAKAYSVQKVDSKLAGEIGK